MESPQAVANTIITIAIAVIGIIGAFTIAYFIYIRGKQDDYSLKVRNSLRELNGIIASFGELEETRYPEDWTHPASSIGTFFAILQNESWEDSPEKTFQKEIENYQSEFDKALEEESKHRFPPILAQYLPARFALRDLIGAIYREFPAPPGDYEMLHGSPKYLRSFVKDDFPRNKDEFIKWAFKYRTFYTEIQRVYQYRIRHFIIHLKEINRRSAEIAEIQEERYEQLRKDWEKRLPPETLAFFRRSERMSEETSSSEIAYYESFFKYFRTIFARISETIDNIEVYESFQFSNWKYAIYPFFFLMIVFGLVLPIMVLFGIPFPTANYMRTLVTTLIIFSATACITLYLLITEVTRR